MTDIKQAQAALDYQIERLEKFHKGTEDYKATEQSIKALKAYIEREKGLSQQASTGWRNIDEHAKSGEQFVILYKPYQGANIKSAVACFVDVGYAEKMWFLGTHSGMGNYPDVVDEKNVIAYTDLPPTPKPTGRE